MMALQTFPSRSVVLLRRQLEAGPSVCYKGMTEGELDLKKSVRNFEEYILEAKRFLQEDTDVIFAYLFGSYAVGKEDSLSDIDIAIYLTNGGMHFYLKKEKELAVRLMSIFGAHRVDLILLNVVPTLLQYRIIKSGEPIVSKDEIARTNYETRVMLKYFDLKPHLQEYDRELYKRIKLGAI